MALLQRTQPVLGEAREGAAAGEGGERLLHRQPLRREPATGGLPLRILAAHRRGEAGERVRAFHRIIGAEGQRRVILQHRAPGIGTAEPVHAHPRFGHQPVGGLVGRLHRGDDRVAPEARQVRRVDDLGMLDPPAPVAFVGVRQFLDRGQQFGIGGVADRVDGDLEIVHRRPAHLVLELGVAEQGQAALPRRVAVIGLEPGAARPERAVQVELHPAHAQMPVIEPGCRPRSRDRQQIVDARRIGEDADAELAEIAGPAHHRPVRGRGAHVGGAGDAVGEQYLLRPRQRPVALQRQWRRHRPVHQVHRIVDEDAAGRAADPLDPAALRRLRRRGDVRLAHRQAVRPAGMAVHPLQPDRPIGDRGVEIGGGREAAQMPALLVPASPDDPAWRRIGRGIGANPRLRLLQAVRVAEVNEQGAHAKAHHMAVRVDQAGDQGPPAPVEPEAGPRRPPVAGFEQLPDPPVIADPHRLEAEQPPVLPQGVAVDIVHQDIGGGGGRGAQEQGGEEEKEALHAAGDKACLRAAPVVRIPARAGPFRSAVTLPVHGSGEWPSQADTDRRIRARRRAIALPNRARADHKNGGGNQALPMEST